jgi:hypothetical protein
MKKAAHRAAFFMSVILRVREPSLRFRWASLSAPAPIGGEDKEHQPTDGLMAFEKNPFGVRAARRKRM